MHDAERVEQARARREREALARSDASYGQMTENPVPVDELVTIMRMMSA